MELGLHMGNWEWEVWSNEEVNAILDLKPRCLLVPLYDSKSSIALIHAAQLKEILSRLPGCRLLYRCMGEGIPTKDPIQWAQECVARYSVFSQVQPGGLIVANEMNLPSEGGSEDYGKIITWLRTCLAVVRHYLPNVDLHLPALAPLDNWRNGLYAMVTDPILHNLVNSVDVHFYGSKASQQMAQAEGFVDKPLYLTEFNQVFPSVISDDKNYVAGCWFICGGTADQSQYNIIGSTFYDDFKNAARAAYNGGAYMDDQQQIADLTKRVEALEKRDGLIYQVLVDILNGDIEGAAGAKGLLVELNGGKNISWKAQSPKA